MAGLLMLVYILRSFYTYFLLVGNFVRVLVVAMFYLSNYNCLSRLTFYVCAV